MDKEPKIISKCTEEEMQNLFLPCASAITYSNGEIPLAAFRSLHYGRHDCTGPWVRDGEEQGKLGGNMDPPGARQTAA